MFDAGVGSPLGELLPSVRSVVGGVDVDRLEVPGAVRLIEECAEAERLLAALRVVVTATLENKAVWRRDGYRSVAAWMASKTGTAVGAAIATVEMVKLLDGLPVLAAAFRSGLLSEAQAKEIAEVASEVPAAEAQLVEAAGKLTLKGLREECQRVEAAALIDEDDRHRRVHKQRRTRAWIRKGVGHFSAAMTPDELARLMAGLDARTTDIVEDAIRGRWFESREAHSVDALIDLVRPDSAPRAGPDTMVHVVVDYDALVRGHTVAGEQCEIPGVGPIPVSVARHLAQDSILKVLVTKGVDVVTVAHAGYTVPSHLRSALDVRDPTCIVPGHDIRRNLEKDHRNSYN
ncbi:MAG: 13E12 repeat family protein, partial [Actinobacteria bacterium]|nr:13E12 repeat family protein [Actinomycetota bacterium]